MTETIAGQAATPLVVRGLARVMAWLQPGGVRPGREAYQLRFLTGAGLLGALVAVVVLPVAAALGLWLSVALLGSFLAALVLQAAAVRVGAPIGLVARTVLGSVGCFLVASALLPRTLQASQLYWFLLIPLAARALGAPRPDDPGEPRSWGPELIAGGAALAAIVLVLVLHAHGLNFGMAVAAEPAVSVGLDVALFLLSALGLLYVHDLSVRETSGELRRLQALLSICAWCRKIRDEGEWIGLEQYVAERQNAELSHGMCPACYERNFGEGEP